MLASFGGGLAGSFPGALHATPDSGPPDSGRSRKPDLSKINGRIDRIIGLYDESLTAMALGESTGASEERAERELQRLVADLARDLRGLASRPDGEDPGEAAAIAARRELVRGLAAKGAGKTEDALAAFDAALEAAPNFAPAWLFRGEARLFDAGQTETALQDLSKCITLDSRLQAARKLRVLALARLGRLPQAIEELDRLLEESPRSRFGLFLRGYYRINMAAARGQGSDGPLMVSGCVDLEAARRQNVRAAGQLIRDACR